MYGYTVRYPIDDVIVGLASTVDRLAAALGDEFDNRVRVGSMMSPTDAVRYARDQIARVRALLR